MQIVIDIDENLYTRLFDNGVDNYDDAVDMAKAIRKGTPLPKAKTGHWIYTDYYTWCCSECGGEPYFYKDIHYYKYCPYCGAKMGVEDGNN